jgi:hypothetical protein
VPLAYRFGFGQETLRFAILFAKPQCTRQTESCGGGRVVKAAALNEPERLAVGGDLLRQPALRAQRFPQTPVVTCKPVYIARFLKDFAGALEP